MPITGSEGDVSLGGTAVADVRTWSLNLKHESKTYRSSDTAGETKALQGPKGPHTASVSIYTDANGDVPVAIGDQVAVALTAASGKTYTGTANVDDITVDVDIENQEVIGATLALTFDGAVTPPA